MFTGKLLNVIINNYISRKISFTKCITLFPIHKLQCYMLWFVSIMWEDNITRTRSEEVERFKVLMSLVIINYISNCRFI